MWRMANDGQLVAAKGRYTLRNPVTSVTLLPDEQGEVTELRRLHLPQGVTHDH